MRLIVVAIVLGAIGWVYLQGERDGGELIRPPSESAAATAPPAKPAPAGQTQKAPGPGEMSVTVSEQELSRLLNQQLAGRAIGQTPLGSASIDRIQVALRSGAADASGDARLGAARVPFTSRMSAQPDGNGRVKVKVEQAKIASLELPEAARAELQTLVQGEVDRLLEGQPIRVRSVEIGNGQLRAVGAPRA